MTAERGLQRRLVIAFTVFGLVLAVLAGGLLYAVYHDSEDAVQRRYLEAQLDLYLEQHGYDPPAVVQLDRFVTAYRELDNLPRDIRNALRDLGPGFHEIGSGRFGADSAGAYQVLMTSGEDGRPLAVVLDTTPFETNEDVSASLVAAIAAVSFLVAVVGAGLGATVARSIVGPVVRLAERVRAGGSDTARLEVDPTDYPAEVGVLAQALRDAFRRIAAFVERERQFTANASHELRTPVTVIAGAAELIGARADASEPSLARPLHRIRRATEAMEETIEVFLLLAREDAVNANGPPVSLRTVADDVVDQLSHLVGDLPVAIQVDVPADVRLAADERVLSIVLGNLVRNALQRTERGIVRVRTTDEGLEVSDTGPGIPAHLVARVTDRGVRSGAGGHGLGLAIVHTLCERCGWRLQVDSTEGEGTRVTLQFR